MSLKPKMRLQTAHLPVVRLQRGLPLMAAAAAYNVVRNDTLCCTAAMRMARLSS
jgi:hypothetical protein